MLQNLTNCKKKLKIDNFFKNKPPNEKRDKVEHYHNIFIKTKKNLTQPHCLTQMLYHISNIYKF